MKRLKQLIFTSVCMCTATAAMAQTDWKNDFSNTQEKLNTVGRGECIIKNGALFSRSAYARFGQDTWKDYTMSFRARAPKDAEQVQIWAGFRATNRFDRYIVALKGGLLNELYLARLGHSATDQFLGVRPLDFSLQPGEWYKLKIEVCGNRIRIFLNDEKTPRMDIEDKDAACAPAGQVTLGGGWINTEFDDLEITPLAADALADIPRQEYKVTATAAEKEAKRQQERAAYAPIKVMKLNGCHTDISLDGNWLFMPTSQVNNNREAVSANAPDNNWHVMSVPNFWTPIRIWLHGETMPAANGNEHKGTSDTYYHQETQRCENYTFDYEKTTGAWYRQWVELPEEIRGKHITLTFDAISKFSDIYINGKFVTSNIGMFGEIKLDASKLMKPGKNLIAVKVMRDLDENKQDNGGDAFDYFYTITREQEKSGAKKSNKNVLVDNIPHGFYKDNPGGIWQPVKLTITQPLKIEDVFIKPSLDAAALEVTIQNHGNKKASFALYTDIIDKETGAVLYSGLSLDKLVLDKGESQLFTYNINNLKPRLWTPQHPNLYDFRFRLEKEGEALDCLTETSGFRTFEAKNGLLHLNGKPYWLRGANHLPFALAPNDNNLADTFMRLMQDGHIEVTRTHTSPWNKLWMNASDRNGIGVSYEGTWPWFMISNTPIPDEKFIEIWRKEFLSLVKKYRNHPSLLFWTMNNEMYFYDYDDNMERAKKKYRIISDVIKEMRKIDPTRPINFDSGFLFKGKRAKYGDEFLKTVDSGDIDDRHDYPNWYNNSIFQTFNGEFQAEFRDPEHPFISQEMASGYPNNETGHPTRSYQLQHQTPQTFVGYEAYDFADPDNYLNTQAFLVGEVGESLRRSNDKSSGFMHFALLTWFRQTYDYQNIEPYSIYYSLKRALQPVLVSAELWARNYYAGDRIPARFCVINDLESGRELQPTLLRWEVKDETGEVLTSGTENIPAVGHYKRHFMSPRIVLPAQLKNDRMKAKLVLKLTENGIPVSENEYDLLLANKSWNQHKVNGTKKILLIDKDGTKQVLDFLKADYSVIGSVQELPVKKAEQTLCILSGMDHCSQQEAEVLHSYISKGGKVLFLNSKEAAQTLYPDYIKGWFTPTEGDIVNMMRNDSRVFDNIGVLELRYFNNDEQKIPTVCNAVLNVSRNKNVLELANHMKVHNYIQPVKPADRIEYYNKIAGLTLFQVKESKGIVTVSTMCTEKADTDPIAGKLLLNLINDLQQETEWKE